MNGVYVCTCKCKREDMTVQHPIKRDISELQLHAVQYSTVHSVPLHCTVQYSTE